MKNIKKFSVKSLSVLLAVLIALFSLPLTAFAVSFEQTPPSSGESSVTKKEIIELRELRDANTKHFRLEDGTFYAAQYDSAVHYLDENGEWQDIDNTLSESGDTYATNDQKIKFAKKTNGSGEIFTLHDGNRKLTLTLQGANKKISGIVTNNETEFSDGTSKITKMTTLDKISASILYADILENTDLEYVVNSGNIKENIIVKAKAANYSYVFSMSLNNLSAEMNENGEIEICDPSTGELAYRIPAPFMCDASGEYSSNITLALESSGGNGKYILTVTADAEWINAEDRAFPVTIDPPLNTVPTANSVYCTYIDSTVPNSNYGSDAYAYVGSTQKIYWQLNSLPTIPSSAYITDARFTATAYSGGAIGGYVGVYGVYEYWDEGHNQSAYDEGGLGMHNSDFTDFQYVYESSSFYIDKDYTFNITPLVRDWYEYDNYGLVLAPVSGQSFNGSVAFYSDDYSVAGVVPRLTVSYRDIKGLESYWTAAGQDAGFAGSSSVNYATGNLVVAIPTLTTTDALMPVSPTMVYNSALTRSDNFYTVNGFKLSICETITFGTYTDQDGNGKTYYKWNDSDGTDHYFMPTTVQNVYADEDGLLLTLNVLSSGYTITDDSGGVRTFNSYGYLTSIEDKIGNKVEFGMSNGIRPISINLVPKDLISIEQLKIGYNSSGRLTHIWNPNSGEAVIFRYSEVASDTLYDIYNCIPKVIRAHSVNNAASASEWATFAAGTSTVSTGNITVDAIATYEYDDVGRMIGIKNELSRYKVSYSYTSGGKVQYVTEYGYNALGAATQGQKIEFTYGTSDTVVRTSGTDDIFGTSDDLLTRYIFDPYGRTVSGYTTDSTGTVLHGASSAEYVGEENESVKNNIKTSTSTTNQSSNYLRNGGFEDGLTGWTYSSVISYDDYSMAQQGGGYANMSLSSSVSRSYIYQNVNLEKGDYSLSAYINNYNAGNVEIYLKAISNQNSAHSKTERISVSPSGSQFGYSFASMDFVAAPSTSGGSETFTIYVEVIGSASSAVSVRVDSVMLSKGVGASDFAAIEFGHFESSNTSASATDKWFKYDVSSTDPVKLTDSITVVDAGDPFGNVLKVNGGINNNVVIRQRLYETTDTKISNYNHGLTEYREQYPFVLSAWAKSSAVGYNATSKFEIKVIVEYSPLTNSDPDGNVVETFSLKFDKGTKDWQFVSACFEIDRYEGLVYSVDVEICYDNNPGYAYFDNISLVSGEGNVKAYNYNSNGYANYIKYGTQEEWNFYDTVNPQNVVRTVTSDRTIVDYSYTYDIDDDGVIDVEEGLVEKVIYKSFRGPIKWKDNGTLDESKISITEETEMYYLYNDFGQPYMTVTWDLESDLSTYTSTIYNTTDYNIFGTVKSESDELGNTTRYFYDYSTGRLSAVLYPEGNGISYAYDHIGNLTNVYPAEYDTTWDVYYTEYNSNSVTYDYEDATNRLTSISTESTTYNFTYDVFGNSESVKVGNNTLASYDYNANNGKISSMTYGNGLVVKYLYDELDRVYEIQYNTGSGNAFETVCEYTYDQGGRLYSSTDTREGVTTWYKYDPSGKLLQTIVSDDAAYKNQSSVSYTYNENAELFKKKDLISYKYYVSGTGLVNTNNWAEYVYVYNDDGTLSSMGFGSTGNLGGGVTPEYDNFGRTTEKVYDYVQGTSDIFYGKVTYQYKVNGSNQSALVSQYKFERGLSSGNLSTSTYNYTYDDNGNIIKITDANGTVQNRYEYDDLDQLVREDNRALGKTYVWTYDNAGNILSKKTYAFTTGTLGAILDTLTYSYGNSSWGDQLISANGWVYTYDAIGNPLTKTSTDGYNGYRYVWEGRRLKEVYQCWYDEGTLTYDECIAAYTYNADGIRTKKNSNEYLLDGTRIVSEGGGNLVYIYDETGSPIGVKYRTLAYAEGAYDYFFYEKNLQGDIVAIYNENGTKIATYTYDAWGNFVKSQTSGVTYSTADTYVYNNNPFTYRGYYYDSETGWYYLQTRYYDPEIGRFISADGYVNANGDIVGFNMFAYCSNNPIMYTDPTGEGIVEFFQDIWESVEFEIGLGVGFGFSLEIEHGTVNLYSKYDFFNVRKNAGETNVHFGNLSEEQAGADAFTAAFDFGRTDYRDFMGNVADSEEIEPDFDPTVGKGVKLYIGWLGVTLSGGINVEELINNLFNLS